MLEMAITGGLCALLLSLVLTPLVRRMARRYGYVAHPRVDRWHEAPTAMFGGVAIFVAFAIPFAVLHDHDRSFLFMMIGARLVACSQLPFMAREARINPKNMLPESPMKIVAG